MQYDVVFIDVEPVAEPSDDGQLFVKAVETQGNKRKQSNSLDIDLLAESLLPKWKKQKRSKSTDDVKVTKKIILKLK